MSEPGEISVLTLTTGRQIIVGMDGITSIREEFKTRANRIIYICYAGEEVKHTFPPNSVFGTEHFLRADIPF